MLADRDETRRDKTKADESRGCCEISLPPRNEKQQQQQQRCIHRHIFH